jgi:hypothetical protein
MYTIKYYIIINSLLSHSSRINEVNIHAYASSARYYKLNPNQNQIIENANENDDHDNSKNPINRLDIAEGLKNMLISNRFSLQSLLVVQPNELAEIFGIDEYVAKLIIAAANNLTIKHVRELT